MNMVRISVNPHQLEAILHQIAHFQVESVTLREVRELEPGFSGSLMDPRHMLNQPRVLLELFAAESITPELLTMIKKAAPVNRSSNADAILLNCESYQPHAARGS